MGQHCTTFYSRRHASNRSAAVGEVRAMAGGACGGEARPVSGGRGSCASACCALRHGGSAIARLPSPPAASASMRFRFGLALRFRKPAALPRGLVASVRSARSSRSPARGPPGRSTAPRNSNRKSFARPWCGGASEGEGGANPPGVPLRIAGTTRPTNWATSAESRLDAAGSRQSGGTPPKGRRNLAP